MFIFNGQFVFNIHCYGHRGLYIIIIQDLYSDCNVKIKRFEEKNQFTATPLLLITQNNVKSYLTSVNLVISIWDLYDLYRSVTRSKHKAEKGGLVSNNKYIQSPGLLIREDMQILNEVLRKRDAGGDRLPATWWSWIYGMTHHDN